MNVFSIFEWARGWPLAIFGCLFSAMAFDGYAQMAETSKPRSFTFKTADTPEITVYYALPVKPTSRTRVLMVMAGRQRNADEYLNSWTAWAAKNDYLVLSPRFDEENWPEPLGYNFGNIASGKERDNQVNPRSKWAFTVVERLFDEARVRFSIKTSRYDLFGHSAGAQFVHRFMLYSPENRVRLPIAANPGFYTLPDPAIEFPYGVKSSPVPVSDKRLRDWAAIDLVLMRGTADVERTANLRQSPEADAQGRNRFERAAHMFARIRKFNPKTKWTLVDVAGIAHDQKGMALAAQKVLESRR